MPGPVLPHPSAHPRVLVVVASRHGATREIAAVLARRLRRSLPCPSGGVPVALLPVHSRPDPAGHDAVVLGSPVYDGRWLPEAVAFTELRARALRTRPLWLFTSGLPGSAEGDDPAPEVCDDALRAAADLGARGHCSFSGRLEPRLLSREERLHPSVRARRNGDRRDWGRVLGWADQVAADVLGAELVPSSPASATSTAG